MSELHYYDIDIDCLTCSRFAKMYSIPTKTETRRAVGCVICGEYVEVWVCAYRAVGAIDTWGRWPDRDPDMIVTVQMERVG